MRPASALAKIANSVKSSIKVTYSRSTIDAKSIIHLLSLMVKENSLITITIEGEDASEAFFKVKQALHDWIGPLDG